MNKRLYTTTAPSIILEIDELSFGARITLFNIAHLLKMKWTISQGLLMKKGGISKATLNRCLNELEEKNLIKRETKYLQGNKGKKTDIVINWEEIFKYATEDDWYQPKEIEENNIPCNAEQQEEHINNSNNSEPEEVIKDNSDTIIEDNTYMEQNIEIENKENNIEDMGNLLVFDETTGQYKYPSKTKEQIKEKVLEKNLPTCNVAATAHTPNSNITSFQDFLKKTAHTINDIIEDFKAGGIRARVQAPANLNEDCNYWGNGQRN